MSSSTLSSNKFQCFFLLSTFSCSVSSCSKLPSSTMDVDNVELKISTDLDEEIRLKVDYYFSDINLNYNKYLRNLLKQSSNNGNYLSFPNTLNFLNFLSVYFYKEISLEELMKFHAIHHLVNGDEELLFKHLCDLKCENACFVPESRTITRNPDKPFVFDKNYFKNLSSNIVYAGNLSPNTTVSSLSQWASRYGHCSILPLKREKNCIAIQSALIGQYCLQHNENLFQYLFRYFSFRFNGFCTKIT